MELITKRYMVDANAAITPDAPLTINIELPAPVLEKIAIYTPDGSLANDKCRGVKVCNNGNPIFPLIGQADSDAGIAPFPAFFVSMKGYAPIPANYPDWIELHKKLVSPPHLEISIVDDGTIAAPGIYELVVMILCGPESPAPATYQVVPLPEVIAAMVNRPQDENE